MRRIHTRRTDTHAHAYTHSLSVFCKTGVQILRAEKDKCVPAAAAVAPTSMAEAPVQVAELIGVGEGHDTYIHTYIHIHLRIPFVAISAAAAAAAAELTSSWYASSLI